MSVPLQPEPVASPSVSSTSPHFKALTRSSSGPVFSPSFTLSPLSLPTTLSQSSPNLPSLCSPLLSHITPTEYPTADSPQPPAHGESCLLEPANAWWLCSEPVMLDITCHSPVTSFSLWSPGAQPPALFPQILLCLPPWVSLVAMGLSVHRSLWTFSHLGKVSLALYLINTWSWIYIGSTPITPGHNVSWCIPQSYKTEPNSAWGETVHPISIALKCKNLACKS